MQAERYLRLRKIYALYDDCCNGVDRFCDKGCASCCTNNVTLTTLEAGLILAHWEAHGQSLPLTDLDEALRRPRFRPSVTTNQFAELCAAGVDGPDEAADPDTGVCPLLKEDLCTIYGVRPFGCRAMQSASDCRLSGTAEMPEWVLSANSLFLQYIEALDIPGAYGNIADILLLMSVPEHRAAYERGDTIAALEGMPANRSIPLLMIPPEHRRRLQGLARNLQQIVQPIW